MLDTADIAGQLQRCIKDRETILGQIAAKEDELRQLHEALQQVDGSERTCQHFLKRIADKDKAAKEALEAEIPKEPTVQE